MFGSCISCYKVKDCNGRVAFSEMLSNILRSNSKQQINKLYHFRMYNVVKIKLSNKALSCREMHIYGYTGHAFRFWFTKKNRLKRIIFSDYTGSIEWFSFTKNSLLESLVQESNCIGHIVRYWKKRFKSHLFRNQTTLQLWDSDSDSIRLLKG